MLSLDGRPIRALLLDLDDTLLDNRSGMAAAWDHVSELLARGLGDVPAARVREEIAVSTEWFWADDARHRWGRLNLHQARCEILTRVLKAFGRDEPELADTGSREYSRHRDGSMVLFEGARELLVRLREVVPLMALVTNGAADMQRRKVERFALEPYFDHVQIEGEVGMGKPDAEVWTHALGTLDVDPHEALMAGDNFECDVLGPLESGLHAAWIDPDGRASPPAPRPYLTVTSVHELAARLGLDRKRSPWRGGRGEP